MIIFSCEEIILGGDFNLVRDATKDKKGEKLTTHRNPESDSKYSR